MTTATGLPSPYPPSFTKQRTWNEPVIQADRAAVRSCATGDLDRARLTAVSAEHSVDWLHARPISSCELWLDDEAIREAVDSVLVLTYVIPTVAHVVLLSMSKVYMVSTLSCQLARCRMPRHQALNDLIWRALSKAGIPSAKEPSGLSRTDGKRSYGVTLIPWQKGKPLDWDVAV